MAMLMALGDLLESQERWLYTLWIRLTVPFTDFSPFGDLTAGLHQNTNCIFDVHYLVTCRHGSDHVSVNSTLASQSPRDLEARVMPEHAI